MQLTAGFCSGNHIGGLFGNAAADFSAELLNQCLCFGTFHRWQRARQDKGLICKPLVSLHRFGMLHLNAVRLQLCNQMLHMRFSKSRHDTFRHNHSKSFDFRNLFCGRLHDGIHGRERIAQ